VPLAEPWKLLCRVGLAADVSEGAGSVLKTCDLSVALEGEGFRWVIFAEEVREEASFLEQAPPTIKIRLRKPILASA
jgi:hypothetical protein